MNQVEIVTLERHDDIAVIRTNNPPVNTINAAVRAGLKHALEELQTMRDIRAVALICSGNTFFSGADIGEFSGPPREEEYRALFNAFENLTIPVIAAMHGTVMGGGIELALACHYRIAAPSTRFGMPEVTLGIIPGGGGTQRLPRLIGAEKALDLIVSAKPIDARRAQEIGIVDELVEGDLLKGALEFARHLINERKGPRRTGERNVDPTTATSEIFERFTRDARRLYPNRSAALVVVDAIRAAATLSLKDGLEYETRVVNQCKSSDESKGAVHAFFAERETRKIPGLPADTVAREIKSAGIIGAGTMGGGIAICFANAGIPVTLIDASQEALDRGRKNIDRTYASMVDRGRLSAADKSQRTALIKGSLSYDGLRNADVIIEAVFESMDLKKTIFAKLDKVAKPGAILATNTSTLDIDTISADISRLGDVIGMHFFSPANVMPLLEVVRTSKTSPATIRTVMDLAKPLHKTPVLAKVCYGFIGNRMMEGYAREAERMVLEGAAPRELDSALEEWAMAMRILSVFDMAGIDVGVNVHKANAERFPPDPTYYQADHALFEAGRLGQKNGKGYYRYEPGNRSRLDDPEALAILRGRARKLGVEQRKHTPQEIVERCLYPLLNESLLILEEGVALRASDIDVVWTSGYGFPRYRGGPVFYADTIGLKTLLDGMLKYQSIFGPMHWQPAPLLKRLVEQGITVAEWDAQRGAR
ncbi:MAG TPA: 3-hydroxyacyl-CoA dehydrogenase NAD-binding domain-containing protein [Steroidobacteraceae bacterium]|nr:3-hydroxyacyl-CoA dehydrogenase NAD-binding domain-containing protein [Steroidobacteraceae bacterium]